MCGRSSTPASAASLRFHDSSELNRVNASPRGLALVSEEFASMLCLALDAARATGGLVTPAAGGALIAAGYDRDFLRLPLDGVAVEPARVPSFQSLTLRGVALLRTEPVILDLNGVVKGQTVDDALELLGNGWRVGRRRHRDDRPSRGGVARRRHHHSREGRSRDEQCCQPNVAGVEACATTT